MMHEDRDLERIAERVRTAAPPHVDVADIERVMARGSQRSHERWRSRGRVVPTAGAVALVLLTALAFSVIDTRTQGSGAFAAEDALAALSPGAGKVVHLKTRTWAKNDGDAEPIEPGTDYWEAWIDFDGNRSRGEAHDAETGMRKMVAVNANGRMGYFGDNVETPEDPSDVVFNESYSQGRVAEGELWAYYYLRTSLPEGEVVGEVERDGDTYWDIRWDNVEDTGGLKLSGRALLRKPDYRPALVERHYPGGAHEIWTVEQWDVVDASSLPSSTFDPQSLRQDDCATQIAWHTDDLKERMSHTVYWAGQKVGAAEIIADWRDPKGPATLEPLFLVSTGLADPIDLLVGTSVRSWYQHDETTVTVAAAPKGGGGKLRQELDTMTDVALVERASALGTATVASLPGGDTLAAIIAEDAVVLVQSRDEQLLDAALSNLRKLE